LGWATCGGKGRARVDTTGDMAVVRAHVQVMRELAALNSSWMEIAYSPAGARRIVQSNKLAVVLGVEVPQLGLPADGSVADQVEELVGLGIRQVAPIHAMDNALGGPAVYEDFYNSVSDWMNRPADIRDVGLDLAGAFDNEIGPHAFYNVELDPEKTEPILLRLGKPTRIVLSDAFPRPGECESRFFSFAKTGCVHPFISTTPKLQKPVSPYKDLMGGSTGHRNVRGLTGRGQEYVSRLIGRGVLVDVAHMSDRALLDARATIDRACPGHPVMMSHAGFRKLMFRDDYSALGARFVEDTAGVVRANPDMSACVKDSSKCPRSVIEAADRAMKSAKGPGSLNKSFLPKEFDARTSTVDDIRKRGGVLGVFVGQDPIDSRALAPDVALPFANDCAGSSKGFAAALLFARAHLSPEQVAVASDLVMHSNLVPRFGKHACALYAKAGSGSASGLQYLETLLNRAQYRFADQRGAVRYAKGNPTMCAGDARDVRCGNNAPLEPYRMGKRVFDFNVDGFAHVGMLPDLLQDVKNMGVATGPLFSSAEGAIAMWEAAWGAAGCNEAAEVCNPKPTPLDPDRTCRDGCPSSWNGGAPLTLLEEKRRECRPLEEITLRQGKLRYSPREADEGRNTALLSRQGDWAVFEVPEGKPVEWNCGSDAGDAVRCPAGTRFMKVRRVLETRIGADPICDNPPSFPLPGNRRVMFQCLKAPPDLPLPLPAQAAE
jgi:microsomal dipeptidase-like Zn-dependent dipeptidase